MRVAVTQFALSLNSKENISTCIRIINEAAVCNPNIIVLPELLNSEKSDQEQIIEESLVQTLIQQAKKHNCYLSFSLSLKSNRFLNSFFISPEGKLIDQAASVTKVIETAFGTLGLLAGEDDMSFHKSRDLMLSGAQLLCDSLSTFFLDNTNIHCPARASENKVFLAVANRVGLLNASENKFLAALLASESLISQPPTSEQSIPEKHLLGRGQSQIIAPNGKVLAKLDNDEEGFVFADIDLSDANNKKRPDGTDLLEQRRSELYKLPEKNTVKHSQHVLNSKAESKVENKTENQAENKTPQTANVALFTTYKINEQAIDDVCFYIENNLSDIIQLPELFFVDDKTLTHNPEKLANIEVLSHQIIREISAQLRPFQYVCTSLVLEGKHQAVIINEQGVFALQQQLHFCERYNWTALGDDFNIIELPLEQGVIKVAILTADDANIPEIVNAVAKNHIHALLVPFDIQEPCEVEYHLLSRAAEHRLCIVAATREKSFECKSVKDNTDSGINNNKQGSTQHTIQYASNNKKKIKPQKSTGFVANLTTFSALKTQLTSGKFTGYINKPVVKHQHGKITKSLIFPIATCDKFKL